jgi:SAM-dependent methyltransferase
MNIKVSRLRELYAKKSKHSNYQILPKRLSEIISNDDIDVKSRFELERLEYILRNIDVKNKSILDIGGNSGFFTFEMLENKANKIHYYEGNKDHVDFVKLSAEVLNLEHKMQLTHGYFSFGDEDIKNHYDIILLLNVLHHIGDDFGDGKLSIDIAKKFILKQLNSLAKSSKIIVFQLGFNWKGNRNLCLFENGTKKEMISFIEEGTRNHWKIIKIGIAEDREGIIKYYDLNDKNIERFDHLGEFLNRPIFIMESLG